MGQAGLKGRSAALVGSRECLQATEPHVPTGKKVLHGADLHRRKSYLRALLCIDALWGQGLQTMRGDQHELYYQCLLGGDMEVPPGLKVAALRLRLNEAKRSAPPQLQQDAGEGCELVAPVEPADEAIVVSLRSCPAAIMQPRQASGSRGAALLTAADAEELALSGLAAPPGPQVAEMEDAAEDLPDAAAEDVVVSELRQRRGVDLPPQIPRSILGQRVHLVERLRLAGARGIRVYCSLAEHRDADGAACNKYRIVSASSTRSSPAEPAAYLHAWLHAGPRFADRAAHCAHVPTRADVREALAALQ